MQQFSFENWRIWEFDFWCHEQDNKQSQRYLMIFGTLRLLLTLYAYQESRVRQWSASGIQARPIVSSAVQSPSNPLRLQSYSCRHYTTSILFQTKLCIVLHNLCHIWCHTSVIAKKRSENPINIFCFYAREIPRR